MTFAVNSPKSPNKQTKNHTQEPYEWVDADLGVLWIESEQILHLKVGCPNIVPVRGSAIYPTYLYFLFLVSNKLKIGML